MSLFTRIVSAFLLFSASDHRDRMRSTSDEGGEGGGICEVESATDASASPAAASRDGAVRVQDSDTLTVTYYQADGVTVIGSHSVNVANLTSLPAVSGPVLGGMAVLFVVDLVWMHRRQRGHIGAACSQAFQRARGETW